MENDIVQVSVLYIVTFILVVCVLVLAFIRVLQADPSAWFLAPFGAFMWGLLGVAGGKNGI